MAVNQGNRNHERAWVDAKKVPLDTFGVGFRAEIKFQRGGGNSGG